MKKPFKTYLPVALLTVLALFFTGFAMVLTDFKPFKKIKLGDEKELKVTIEGGLADIFVSRGNSSSILDAERATGRYVFIGFFMALLPHRYGMGGKMFQ